MGFVDTRDAITVFVSEGVVLQRAMIKRWSDLVAVLILSVLLGPACVKVEVGPEAEGTRTADADVEAHEYRAVWVGHFNQAKPGQQAELVRTTIDTLCLQFLDYGYRVASHWHDANKQGQDDVPADEMKRLITDWTASQTPMFEGYEDALEYGMEELRRQRNVDDRTLEVLQKHLGLYYDIYRTVYRPSGTADDYERDLDMQRIDLESVSQEVLADLRKYN